ncbi:MAG: Hsp20/alpha crystallin family protein [Acidobacteria bacterium]|nr:Hsp20/alpha crystallin family protein [Acidobacteriota bacterium]
MTWMIGRDPFSDLRGIQADVNRIFNGAFPRYAEQPETTERGSWAPGVDISEGEQAIVLEADLPGVKPADFKLSIENNVLTLSGERRAERDVKLEKSHRIERHYGRFTRTFTLPATINVEKVSAELRDGVLRVTLPKREEVRARQIQVTVRPDSERPATAEAAKAI